MAAVMLMLPVLQKQGAASAVAVVIVQLDGRGGVVDVDDGLPWLLSRREEEEGG